MIEMLVSVVILVILDIAALRWGFDSRFSSSDRYDWIR
jgi:hypothetical protein